MDLIIGRWIPEWWLCNLHLHTLPGPWDGVPEPSRDPSGVPGVELSSRSKRARPGAARRWRWRWRRVWRCQYASLGRMRPRRRPHPPLLPPVATPGPAQGLRAGGHDGRPGPPAAARINYFIAFRCVRGPRCGAPRWHAFWGAFEGSQGSQVTYTLLYPGALSQVSRVYVPGVPEVGVINQSINFQFECSSSTCHTQ